jgi:release factor glutamine methyltransferase
VAERGRGVPIAYLTGSAGFYGRLFDVTRDVLVPRPETEHLVESALAFLRERALEPPRICDVGTGSGIIAITLASEVPDARVTAIDISPAALAVAERNARLHGVDARVEFLAADLLETIPPATRFDCIAANLPYVRSIDLKAAPDPTAFEPRVALEGGADGLALYRRLLARAPALLAAGGAMFLEAGPDSADGLAALAGAAFGARALVRVQRDYAARERVVEIRREGEPVPTKGVLP